MPSNSEGKVRGPQLPLHFLYSYINTLTSVLWMQSGPRNPDVVTTYSVSSSLEDVFRRMDAHSVETSGNRAFDTENLAGPRASF